MGGIVNHFCDEIVKKVMACEDISSETSNGLVCICETIIERLPAIFTVSKFKHHAGKFNGKFNIAYDNFVQFSLKRNQINLIFIIVNHIS